MKRKPEKGLNGDRWLLTYSDLITLLMVLFVILYASSNVDTTKYQQIAASFQKAFNISSGSSGQVTIIDGQNSGVSDINPSTATATSTATISEEVQLAQVKAQVDTLISQSGLNNKVTTKVEERGLVISFTDSIFFDSGQANVKNDYKQQLIDISKVLNQINNYIRVEGHTDNIAIKNQYYNSNWQLSSVRAANVVEIFINQCGINPNRLSAIGYGEFRPVQSNDTDAGRAANRRVDIVVLNTSAQQSELSK